MRAGGVRGVPALVVALLLTGVAALPTGSARAAAPSPTPYAFTLRSTAVENFVNLFREMGQGVGFSRSTLTRLAGAREGEAEAIGAGAWTLLEDEPCLLGCDPPCTSPTVGNPSMARASHPRSCADQRAGLFTGTASPPGQAAAPSPASAVGAGRAVGVTSFPGLRVGLAGSDVTASVQVDGQYVGTAHSYLTDVVTASGQIRSITSTMRVNALPDGSLPTVTTSFSVVGLSSNGSRAGINERGFTIFGQDIPATDLVRWFNAQLQQVVGIAGVLGQVGVRVLDPQVGLSDDGRRYRITAPALVLGAEQGVNTQGLSARAGGLRLASGVFEGSYDQPDAPAR
jgi:hypothetical protein